MNPILIARIIAFILMIIAEGRSKEDAVATAASRFGVDLASIRNLL